MKTITEYKDLSKYQFLHYENALNIGWHNNKEKIIANKIDYIDDEFLIKLKIHCDKPINIDRCGKHRYFDEKHVEGFGEIRILDLVNNIRYASPNIIYRDILDGLYVPTKEFVLAVKNAPLPDDKIYIDFISRYTKEYYYGENKDTSLNINTMISDINNGNINKYFNKFPNMINSVTLNGSILNMLIMKSYDKEVEYILNTNIDLNAFQGIELITALEMNNSYIAKLLISNNIEINTNYLQTNPLYLAIRNNEPDIVKQLLETNKETIKNYKDKPSLVDITKKYNNIVIIEMINKLK